MRESSRIESLSYGMIYLLGCVVAAFISFSQHTPLQRMVMHVIYSWGYVIYYILNVQ